MTAGVAGRDMDIGADTDRGLVPVGTVALIVRARVTGTAIVVIAITAMAIAGIMTAGGIRSQHSARVRSLAVRLPLRRLSRSIAHRLTVTAMHTSNGAITVIGHTGPRIILFSRITALDSSVIRHTDRLNLLNTMKPLLRGGFVLWTRSIISPPVIVIHGSAP